jgi:hypothetical protein
MGATGGLSEIMPSDRMGHDHHHPNQNPRNLDCESSYPCKIRDSGNHADHQKQKWIHPILTSSLWSL